MKDESYLIMRRSEKEFVIERTTGDLREAQAYCRRYDWKAPDGTDLVIYKLLEVMVER